MFSPQMHADGRRFFRVFGVFGGQIRRVLIAAVRPVVDPFWLRASGQRFLSDEPWIAEPDHCTELPFALALGFGSFVKSGLGGR